MGKGFLYGNSGNGGSSGGTLTVTAPAGVTVTVSKEGKTYTKTADSSGQAVFKGLASGIWTVTITDGSQTSSKSVEVTTDYETVMSFNTIPSFTYTGDYEIVDDEDNPITVSSGNWKIRFLTSGTLTFSDLNGADGGIDVFLVGGGGASGNDLGGGGGGGYTNTAKGVSVVAGTEYSIVVGAGGSVSTTKGGTGAGGGVTSAFDVMAKGGSGGKGYTNCSGGNGGSGGSAGVDASGGTDGGDGKTKGSLGSAGKGQGSTTREFGLSDGTLYSSGGSGTGAASGVANTGDGGSNGRSNSAGGSGGSGIVIIRNAREVE